MPRARRSPRRSPPNRRCASASARSRARGRLAWPLDETLDEVRANVRAFAEREILPHAERIHHHDELVPERFITEMAKLGYFGLSIPETYGGFELGNLAMILTTEELSRASLAAAGSLITRPEILAKALLAGGTDEQKQHVAAEARVGRDHGGDLGDRARHRIRCRVAVVSRRTHRRWLR